jgi:hypothetical protein
LQKRVSGSIDGNPITRDRRATTPLPISLYNLFGAELCFGISLADKARPFDIPLLTVKTVSIEQNTIRLPY